MGSPTVRLENVSPKTQVVVKRRDARYAIEHGAWINLRPRLAIPLLGKVDKESGRNIWKMIDGVPEAIAEVQAAIRPQPAPGPAPLKPVAEPEFTETTEDKAIRRKKSGTVAKDADE